MKGLVDKFRVERLTPSSRGIDHTGCRYFVLDPAHDVAARQALMCYAGYVRMYGHEALYDDLMGWVADLDEADRRVES